MKRFIVGLLATIGVLTIILAVAAGVGVWWFRAHVAAKPTLPERTVLRLDLRGGIDEAPDGDPLASFGIGRQPTFSETVLALERAAADPRVRGLVARLDGGGPGFAQIQELRDVIADFRASGRFALAYADSFGELGSGTGGYYLASAFDEIHLQPVGMLGLAGIVLESPFAREILDEIGITPRIERREEFKTAADPLLDSAPSPAFTESLAGLADSVYGQIVAGIAEGRGIDAAAARRLIDRGPWLAEEAVANGLVDALSYADEVVAEARSRAGSDATLVEVGEFIAMTAEDGPEPRGRIALVHGVGAIQRGDSGSPGQLGGFTMGADSVAEAFGAAADDPAVGAIVFRIESPGGSAVASETIGRAVRRAREAGKPVVVSMGNSAASGGYWISMDADRIVAAPGTLTGSIGVIAGKPVLDGLWDKLGVTWAREARGANATMWSVNADYTVEGRARLDALLDEIYEAFMAGVARGRGLDPGDVREAAKGRVWTGEQALALGLVDELGGVREALGAAKEAAGIDPEAAVEVVVYPRPRPPFEAVLDLLRSRGGLAEMLVALVRQVTPGVLTAPHILIR